MRPQAKDMVPNIVAGVIVAGNNREAVLPEELLNVGARTKLFGVPSFRKKIVASNSNLLNAGYD